MGAAKAALLIPLSGSLGEDALVPARLPFVCGREVAPVLPAGRGVATAELLAGRGVAAAMLLAALGFAARPGGPTAAARATALPWVVCDGVVGARGDAAAVAAAWVLVVGTVTGVDAGLAVPAVCWAVAEPPDSAPCLPPRLRVIAGQDLLQSTRMHKQMTDVQIPDLYSYSRAQGAEPRRPQACAANHHRCEP